VLPLLPALALYVALELLVLPVALFFLLLEARHRASILRRFGSGLEARKGALWVHAVSVGEFLAGKQLIAALRRRHPGAPLVVSTVTLTGSRVAVAAGADHCFFPFDLPFVVEQFLDRLDPKAVVILETEVWPYFLWACRRRGVPVVVCNGRLSEASHRRYRRFRPLVGPFFGLIDLVLAQGEADAERFRALGAPRVETTGNIKYDAAEPALPEAKAAWYRAFAAGRRGWVAGSTMPGEEPLVLAAHREVLKADPNAFLVLAPRHPERGGEVAALLEREGFPFVRRSAGGAAERATVLLLDTVGELAWAYSLGDPAFVGGSLVPTGGHNIIEPALFRKAVVTGPHTHNFKAIVEDFRAREAVHVAGPDRFAETVAALFRDPGPSGARAFGVVEVNRGSLDRTLAGLAPFLA
jgi:3-deoxy-D-manno-octulosonic-acid transferase